MLALEVKVEYFMGRVLASSREDRRAVEWPPHPARLFAALTAAYAECDMDTEERAALEWLEALPEPEIYADPPSDITGRDVHDVFVPINDAAQLPERRSRQVRWFPAFTPADPTVSFIWPGAGEAQQFVQALNRIAANVTYLGHSMSPVRVVAEATERPATVTLVPDEQGDLLLRTTGEGRLEYLETIHLQRQVNATIQPRLGKVSRYRIVKEDEVATPRSLFRHGFVLFKKSGPTIPGENAGSLAEIVRQAVIKHVPNPVPEILCGHDARNNNHPSRNPHLAVTPLLSLSASHQRTGSHLMGCVLWLPDTAGQEEIELLEDALTGIEREGIKMGSLGTWQVQRQDAYRAASAPNSLRLRTYTQAADTWASVTPVVFGHHPKPSHVGPGRNGGKVFAEMCEMIGLGLAPVEVRLGPTSVFAGIPMASAFVHPKLAEGKLMAHVWLRFAQPVRGPLLLGQARFAGFGFCRPVFERKPS